eukprot:162440-Rhodomonas_salina.1
MTSVSGGMQQCYIQQLVCCARDFVRRNNNGLLPEHQGPVCCSQFTDTIAFELTNSFGGSDACSEWEWPRHGCGGDIVRPAGCSQHMP